MTTNRYTETPSVDDTKGMRYYLSVIPRSIRQDEIPFYYVTKDGDRLDTISTLFYKTPSLWWVIASANRIANGSHSVPVGTVLYIPTI